MNSNIISTARHPLRCLGLGVIMSVAALLPSSGCDKPPAQTESGEVMLSVGTIPDDVTCVRVTAAGEFRQVVTDFDVVPGATLSQALSGLPVGKAMFSANAYSQDCASLTKSTTPMWLSDEKSVNVAQGKSTSVTLTLYKNGRAKVTVEFADQEDGGTDAGVAADGGV